MNRRHGWILLVFGLLLAVGTGGLVFFVLQQQQQALAEQALTLGGEAEVVPTLRLPVAARPLQPGTVISADDFLLKEFPLDLVPVAAITETIELESQVLVEPVGQGETFNPTKIAGESAEKISQRLPAGFVLFAFPIADLLSEANVVQDGDHIDLMVTLQVPSTDGTQTTSVTAFTLQNIEVLRVLRPGDAEAEEGSDVRPISLLLAVTPEDAVLLKHVKDSGGVLDFVLRSALDQEPVEIPPVEREDLLARYGLR